jgi:hypothetical protein
MLQSSGAGQADDRCEMPSKSSYGLRLAGGMTNEQSVQLPEAEVAIFHPDNVKNRVGQQLEEVGPETPFAHATRQVSSRVFTAFDRLGSRCTSGIC